MNQEEIKNLLKEAVFSGKGCRQRRREIFHEFLQSLEDKFKGAYAVEEFLPGLKAIMYEVYYRCLDEKPEALMGLLPVFVMILAPPCLSESSIFSQVDWANLGNSE